MKFGGKRQWVLKGGLRCRTIPKWRAQDEGTIIDAWCEGGEVGERVSQLLDGTCWRWTDWVAYHEAYEVEQAL